MAMARTRDGGPIRLLVVIDELSRECLGIEVARQIRSDDVLHLLAWLFASRGAPEHIRSDITAGEHCEPTGREAAGRVRRTRPRSGAQRQLVHGGSGQGLDGPDRSPDALHRPGEALGDGYVGSFIEGA